MSGQWKPGDVAVIRIPRRTCPGEGINARGDKDIRAVSNGRGGWIALDNTDYFWNADYSFHVAEPRPLVVIDPEDSDLPVAHAIWEALDDCGTRDFRVQRERIRDALRSLVAPPQPEEPTGLGAVVEDADGVRFVRRDDRGVWVRADQFGFRVWDEISAVRILSGGVA